MDLTVTDKELMEAAQCAHRMTGYVHSDERLLITRLITSDGTPIRLILDQRCLNQDEEPHDTS